MKDRIALKSMMKSLKIKIIPMQARTCCQRVRFRSASAEQHFHTRNRHQLLWMQIMQISPAADPTAWVLDSSSSWTLSPLHHQDFFSTVINSSHIPATPSSTRLCISRPAPRSALFMDSALGAHTHCVIHMGSSYMKCWQVVVMMDLALSLKEQILSPNQLGCILQLAQRKKCTRNTLSVVTVSGPQYTQKSSDVHRLTCICLFCNL